MKCRQIISGIVIVFLFSLNQAFAQNSMGIGTETPNNNAVLHLVSPTNDQGFLVPKVTTAQRTASAFIAKLAATDNGLLVYDTDLNNFFYWGGTSWINIGRVQNLSLSGNTLTISDGTSVDLTPYLDNQTAGEVAVTPDGNLAATNVQAALQELQGDIDAGAAGLSTVNSDATLTGDGTGGSALGVADGGITDAKIADVAWLKIT
jgi:hypothetical protein